jgi:hypothetical protein
MDHVPRSWRYAYGWSGRLPRVLAWLIRRREAHAFLTERHLDALYRA